jgi:aminoglycoside 3-N-acetyltransferase I
MRDGLDVDPCWLLLSVPYACRHIASQGLATGVGEAFDEIDTYQRSAPSDDYLSRLLTKQHFIAVVAMNGSEVVGGLAAYELDKFEQDRREIYIYDLAVVESHRRRGVATG